MAASSAASARSDQGADATPGPGFFNWTAWPSERMTPARNFYSHQPFAVGRCQ